MDSLQEMIHLEFDKGFYWLKIGNERIKTRKVQGRQIAVLTVQTGKGLHSKDRMSVLKPIVQNWCDRSGMGYVINVDNIEVYIPMQWFENKAVCLNKFVFNWQ